MEAMPAGSGHVKDEPTPMPRRPGSPGDPFEALFLAEYGRVVGIANRVLADRDEAEDVAQDVFVDFHRRHPAGAPFAGPWLHSAAVHAALNRVRGRKRRQRREEAVARERLGQSEPDPAHAVEVREQRLQVRQALARLRPKAAAVLALRYSGLSYAEVGVALGVGTGQVGTLLRRAEQALKKELEKEGHGGTSL